MKGSDNQEKLVYQIIEDAGNKGNNLNLHHIILIITHQTELRTLTAALAATLAAVSSLHTRRAHSVYSMLQLNVSVSWSTQV